MPRYKRYLLSFFIRVARSSSKKAIRTLVRLVRSCLDAYARASVHSPVSMSLCQTKPRSLPSDSSSSISESAVNETQDAISGLLVDTPRRDSFSLTLERVLIGGTLIARAVTFLGDLTRTRMSLSGPRSEAFFDGSITCSFVTRDLEVRDRHVQPSLDSSFMPTHVTWCLLCHRHSG